MESINKDIPYGHRLHYIRHTVAILFFLMFSKGEVLDYFKDQSQWNVFFIVSSGKTRAHQVDVDEQMHSKCSDDGQTCETSVSNIT